MWKSILAPKKLSPTVGIIMIAMSTVGYALVPLFAKTLIDAGFASPAIAFYRFLFVGLLLLPVLTFAPEKRAGTFWAMSGGVATGLGWIGYLEALKSTSMATVGVIYMTYPLFTLLIAALWLRQIPQRRTIFAGLLVVVAALIALSPASVGSGSIKPLLFAFSTPLGFAYVIIVLADKTFQLTPLERLVGVSVGATFGLLPLILSLDSSAVIPTRLSDWGLVFGIAIATRLLPSTLYMIAVPFIGSARSAIAGSLELPIVFILGWLTFGEQITLLQSVSGALVITAIWITSSKSSKKNLSEEVEILLPNPKTTASSKAV